MSRTEAFIVIIYISQFREYLFAAILFKNIMQRFVETESMLSY